MSKSQLLQINYKQDQGLIFKWNYNHILTQNIFFRHVIVIFTQEKNRANTYIKKYIKRIKPGDLYCCIYLNQKRQIQKIGWKQKIVLEEIHQQKKACIKEDISKEYRDNIFRQIQSFYTEFSEPIVLTFLLDSTDDQKHLEQKITEGRYYGKYDFMVAFFAPNQKISLSYGHRVSSFSCYQEELQNQLDFFHKTVKRAAILYAKVTIECKNGAITSMSDQNWRTTSFNQIERVYRGPSIFYEKDTLFFFEKSLQDSTEILTLQLEFVTLDKKKFFAEKRFTLNTSKIFYQKTFSTDSWCKQYHSKQNDLWLTENPFTTFTVIKFQENGANRN